MQVFTQTPGAPTTHDIAVKHTNSEVLGTKSFAINMIYYIWQAHDILKLSLYVYCIREMTLIAFS